MDYRRLPLAMIVIMAICSSPAYAAESTPPTVRLTPQERQWLQEHPVIRLAPDPDFRPIEYFDKNGVYRGAAADIGRWITIRDGGWRPDTTFVIGVLAAILGLLLGVSVAWNRSLRKTKAAALSNEFRFKMLFQNMSDPVYISDATGRILGANEQAGRETGYSSGELLQMQVTDIDVSDGASEVNAYFLKNFEREVPAFEAVHRRKDGSRFPVEINIRTIEFDGHPAILGVARNISDRKRAEEILQQERDFIQAALDSLPGLFYLFDDQGHFLRWNRNFGIVSGYSDDEISNMAPLDFFDETGKGPILNGIEQTFATGEATAEAEILSKDRTRTPCFFTGKLFRYDRKPCLIGMGIDITALKRAEEEKRRLEEQVRQTQKLESLGVLAGGIAHDFNNLLMAVLGHAELALTEISPMSAARGSLTEIATAARRAADLCRQMLAYAGKSSFALERVGLRDLVEEMAHLLKTAISKKAILNLNLERGLPPIQADPSQIRQIVMNLIINASEAIGDRSGVITVSVGATRCDEEYLRKTELREDLAPGLYVHLEVSDTGSGMDAQTRARIFEPFFSTKFTGRGLGLAAVLGIVRAHKGALKVYSEPGKGTTFKILFPALENDGNGARTDDSSPLSDWRGTGTILLVDDEESLLALGARMLEHLGFTVLTAADGLQAVDLYRERGKGIDLVLMDLTMPHMDGAEAFGELRRLNPQVRIVLASGYSHEDVASRFAGKGLDGVLQKPYTLLKLREALAGLKPKRPDGEG